MRTAFLLAPIILAAAPALAQDADQVRRELDRAAAEAQARAADDQARLEADRLAAEARRQGALAAEYERRRAQAEAEAQAARAEADLERRAIEGRLRAAEDDARRSRETARPAGAGVPAPLQPSTTQPRGRVPAAPAPRAAGAPGDPVIAMPEGVALCQRQAGRTWRCTGPLRVTFGDVTRSRAAAVDACGAAPIRDLGTVHGLRAFGCGYGLNPRSAAPGNRDAAALFGVAVPGRLFYRCRASTPAGCRSR